ncbi:hypothetical protein [Paenibacillus hamazuiensis]|uniref:hypothetical protein n=1 Tax=Paenibacillus hamazuiensis TaxID=2936508 RepID=UPI00200ED10C|nr:hypothetical protein [Paenibacillus hamazuiensis]
MTAVMKAKTLSVTIERRPEEVYEYFLDMTQFPKWATSFSQSVRKTDEGWIVETPDGPMSFRFAENRAFGVLDHYVSLVPGQEIYNPVRVVANGSGSELMFTLYQQPGMSDDRFAEDAGMVERDLHSLKKMLET